MAFVLPRKKKYLEHINDHQLDFVNFYFNDKIFITFDSIEDITFDVIKGKHLNIPSRNNITNLNGLKEDLHIYINNII